MYTEITGENQFSTPRKISDQPFTCSVTGTFVADVVVQRVRSNTVPDGSASWNDVFETTVPKETNGIDIGEHWYRIGVPTGGYTSGTINVAIYSGARY